MLIYTRHDPRFHDRRLFKGGDGGAGDLRAQEQQRQLKVQSAVDAINSKFNSSPATAGIDPNSFNAPTTFKVGQSNDAQWEKILGDFQNAHTAKFGKAFTRGWGADPDAQAQYDALQQQYRQAKTSDAKAAAVAGGASEAPTRDALYADVSNATRDTALRGLDQQFTTASRQNLYGLADSGLLGGSADAEAGGDLQRRYGEGRIKAQAAGDAAGATLQNNDEQTRQRLIQLAQSGLDTGTASSLAAGQMKAAGDVAASQAQTANVGNLFGDMSQAYLMNRTLAARYPNGLPANPGAQVNYSSSGFAPSRYTGTSS